MTNSDLAKLVAQAVAAALAKGNAKPKAGATPVVTANGLTARQSQNDEATIRAFKRHGLKASQIKPRENVLTFGKWVEKGFVVKEGEKSVKVKNFRLFHESQVRPLTEDEKAQIELDNEAALAAKSTQNTEQQVAA